MLAIIATAYTTASIAGLARRRVLAATNG